jgi:hypothetical protein
MSHEGIRFISEEEAQKLALENGREFPREATEPVHVRVQKTTGTGMTGKTAIAATGHLPGCGMLVRVPPAMRSAVPPAASRVSQSRNRAGCCRCIKPRRGQTRLLP